jgi:hypothetical protein
MQKSRRNLAVALVALALAWAPSKASDSTAAPSSWGLCTLPDGKVIAGVNFKTASDESGQAAISADQKQAGQALCAQFAPGATLSSDSLTQSQAFQNSGSFDLKSRLEKDVRMRNLLYLGTIKPNAKTVLFEPNNLEITDSQPLDRGITQDDLTQDYITAMAKSIVTGAAAGGLAGGTSELYKQNRVKKQKAEEKTKKKNEEEKQKSIVEAEKAKERVEAEKKILEREKDALDKQKIEIESKIQAEEQKKQLEAMIKKYEEMIQSKKKEIEKEDLKITKEIEQKKSKIKKWQEEIESSEIKKNQSIIESQKVRDQLKQEIENIKSKGVDGYRQLLIDKLKEDIKKIQEEVPSSRTPQEIYQLEEKIIKIENEKNKPQEILRSIDEYRDLQNKESETKKLETEASRLDEEISRLDKEMQEYKKIENNITNSSDSKKSSTLLIQAIDPDIKFDQDGLAIQKEIETTSALSKLFDSNKIKKSLKSIQSVARQKDPISPGQSNTISKKIEEIMEKMKKKENISDIERKAMTDVLNELKADPKKNINYTEINTLQKAIEDKINENYYKIKVENDKIKSLNSEIKKSQSEVENSRGLIDSKRTKLEEINLKRKEIPQTKEELIEKSKLIQSEKLKIAKKIDNGIRGLKDDDLTNNENFYKKTETVSTNLQKDLIKKRGIAMGTDQPKSEDDQLDQKQYSDQRIDASFNEGTKKAPDSVKEPFKPNQQINLTEESIRKMEFILLKKSEEEKTKKNTKIDEIKQKIEESESAIKAEKQRKIDKIKEEIEKNRKAEDMESQRKIEKIEKQIEETNIKDTEINKRNQDALENLNKKIEDTNKYITEINKRNQDALENLNKKIEDTNKYITENEDTNKNRSNKTEWMDEIIETKKALSKEIKEIQSAKEKTQKIVSAEPGFDQKIISIASEVIFNQKDLQEEVTYKRNETGEMVRTQSKTSNKDKAARDFFENQVKPAVKQDTTIKNMQSSAQSEIDKLNAAIRAIEDYKSMLDGTSKGTIFQETAVKSALPKDIRTKLDNAQKTTATQDTDPSAKPAPPEDIRTKPDETQTKPQQDTEAKAKSTTGGNLLDQIKEIDPGGELSNNQTRNNRTAIDVDNPPAVKATFAFPEPIKVALSTAFAGGAGMAAGMIANTLFQLFSSGSCDQDTGSDEPTGNSPAYLACFSAANHKIIKIFNAFLFKSNQFKDCKPTPAQLATITRGCQDLAAEHGPTYLSPVTFSNTYAQTYWPELLDKSKDAEMTWRSDLQGYSVTPDGVPLMMGDPNNLQATLSPYTIDPEKLKKSSPSKG